MKRLTTAGMLAAVILAALARPSRAGSQAFDFSFNNISGTVAGTVTGVIDLSFSGDGTGSATSVTITSYPSVYLSIFGSPPITTPVSPYFSTVTANSFTVTGGQITDAQYYASSENQPFASWISLNYNDANTLAYYTPFIADSTGNTLGLSGTTYTPASVPVPEPSSLAIISMAVACGLIFAVATRRRARGTNTKGL